MHVKCCESVIMACVTTINTTPLPTICTSASAQNAMSVANSPVCGTLTIPVVNSNVTAISTVAAPMTVSTSNTVSPTLNISHITQEPAHVQVLNKQRLQDLVREVDPNVHPDEDVEELLLQLAEDFIEDVVDTSCLLAKHRKSAVLEVKDVQLSLEKNWNMWIPGFGYEELRPYKKSAITEAHKQRMASIRKAKK